MNRSILPIAGAATAAIVLLAEGIAHSDDTGAAADRAPLTIVGGPLVVAAGDISCAPGSRVTATTCRDAATARLIKAHGPEHVFVLGDAQYERGRLAAFRNGYAKTWGAFRSITKPVPGNHEYETRGAAGYYTYFRNQTRPRGYYAFNANRWRVYALNSNCSEIDCDRELTWLDRDMTANPRRCSAILMHHPLYSSGSGHGGTPAVRPFWQVAVAHHADLALAGHDHDYERFTRMTANGTIAAQGMTSFVVGTGGKSLYPRGRTKTGSVVFASHRAGVLALRLGDVRFGWVYTTVNGRTIDSGIRRCR